ncbi:MULTISPECIES: Tn3 family transposase [Paraburkholderia]|uniref:Tn3 family transposase n=1 Tax=Paraburkholderia podalyriae TaxID=1938811 RepID=A0ABR7PXQ2_9BURK|nr:Tn3 family transposase [Paraburkholderia podalyriae]MBC8751043.1 Tn3 family transposase [Paraburkholderia podalyriae]
MPVSFVTTDQRDGYGRYDGSPSPEELTRYFHLDDADRVLIGRCRGAHNRLGFALQLCTVRFLGTFLDDPVAVPDTVIGTLVRQLHIDEVDLAAYRDGKQRWNHTAEIRQRSGYRAFSDAVVGFRLSRWLYALCWTGTDRPGALFERATGWLLAHKVLLPGATMLERFIARVRQRVETRLWRMLGSGLSYEARANLEALLTSAPGSRSSVLDRLRSGPVVVSGPSLVRSLERLEAVRALGIRLPIAAHIPPTRIAALARFANTSKVTAIERLPPARRLATLVAFAYTLEASAQDDALEVLEVLLRELFNNAQKADQKSRLRSLKDLDASAIKLAGACTFLLDTDLPANKVRDAVFKEIPRDELLNALQEVSTLVRPPQDVFYRELQGRYRSVRRFLPALLEHIHLDAGPAGRAVVEALKYLHVMEVDPKRDAEPPMAVVSKSWQTHVVPNEGEVDRRAYLFCTLDQLRVALRRRDVFAAPSWRYADPRKGFLTAVEWDVARPVVYRSLGYTANPSAMLAAMAQELDQTYRAVAARLPDNPFVRIEADGDKHELILTPLDKIEEPESLIALRAIVAERLPRVDLPEIILEIAARTGFSKAFTHISERESRADDLTTSLCAVLIAESCNTGFEPLVRQDMPALRRDRLAWVAQTYIRDETLSAANAMLVAAQNQIELAHIWGGGEVASADGMRFVVPVRTVHAGPNPKYYGVGRGVTYYNMVSDQFTGMHGIPVPGTLRDSLVLLTVVLEQQTELQPTQIMTDTGAYTDIIFGLFRLLGYLDDMLRLAGSLKLGRVSAAGIMRTLQVGDRQTQLAKALAEFGRIEKTLHTLTYIDDEAKRRSTLIQLNRGEARHGLARTVFHGKRGELRQRYREGQEDQLSALGLVVNVIVLWNTIYMEAVLKQLRSEGYPVQHEDVARLSPLIHDHANMLGRYSFAVPEAVVRGELRPLRKPGDDANV